MKYKKKVIQSNIATYVQKYGVVLLIRTPFVKTKSRHCVQGLYKMQKSSVFYIRRVFSFVCGV